MSWHNPNIDAGWISTLSGAKVNWYGGLPTIEDMAVSLCRTPLGAGHTSRFFSLAHHCICVATALPRRLSAYGLLHEAEVTVVGDVPGPMKTPSHRRLEKVLRNRIVQSFGIPPITDEIWDRVEAVDQENLAAVSRVFKLPHGEEIWPMSCLLEEDFVRYLVERFPPEEQLVLDSPLSQEFIRTFNEMKGLACA